MSKMQIVIEIPEVFYEALKKTDVMVSGQRSGKTLMSVIYNAVAKGTPLPKGHGRLGDLDKVAGNLKASRDGYDYYEDEHERGMYDGYDYSLDEVMNALTIIEADTESEVKEINYESTFS